MTISHTTDIKLSRMAISHCYWHQVVKNGNFTFVLTSTGQEWQFQKLLTCSSLEQQFTLVLTLSGQKWNFTLLLKSSG